MSDDSKIFKSRTETINNCGFGLILYTQVRKEGEQSYFICLPLQMYVSRPYNECQEWVLVLNSTRSQNKRRGGRTEIRCSEGGAVILYILNSFLPQQLRAPCLPAIRSNELLGGFCLRAQHLLIKITLCSNGRPVCMLVGVGVARRLIVQRVTQVLVSSVATFNDSHTQAAGGGTSCPADTSV